MDYFIQMDDDTVIFIHQYVSHELARSYSMSD